MKPKTTLRRFLAIAGSAALTIPYAQAATGTWDENNNGDWTTATNWVGNTVHAFGTDSTATFGNSINADRVVNLNAAITIGNITASDASNNYTISGVNILTLDRTLGAIPTIDVTTAGRTLTISSEIQGGDGLKKIGAGTLLLSGANTYTGGTTISAGILKVGSATALGANSSAVSVATGAALDLNGTTMTGANALTLAGSGVGSTGALTNSSLTPATYAGLISLSGNTTIGGAGYISITNPGTVTGAVSSTGLTLAGSGGGIINSVLAYSGPGGQPWLNMSSTGTWTLAGVNTWGGNNYSVFLNNGTLNVGAAQTATSGPFGNVTNTGAIITMKGGILQYSAVNQYDYSNIGYGVSGYLNASTAFKVDTNGQNVTWAGAVTGTAAPLTKFGAGTLTLSSAKAYSGLTTVDAGRLLVSGVGALTATSGLSVLAGAEFAYAPTTQGTLLTLGGASSTLTLVSGSIIGETWGSAIKANSTASVPGSGTIVLNLSGSFTSGNTYNVLQATSGLDSGASFRAINTNYTYTTSVTGSLVTITPTTAAAQTTLYWMGGSATGTGASSWIAGDGSTTLNSNWATDTAGTRSNVLPGATTNLIFSATGTTNQAAMNLDAPMSVNSITVNGNTASPNETNAITLGAGLGQVLTLGSTASPGITVNAGSGVVTLNAPIQLGIAQSWTNNNPTGGNQLAIGGAVTNNGFLLTLTGGGDTTISNIVRGTGGLTKSGTGTGTLSATNTYTGATTVSGGKLTIASTGTINSTSLVSIGSGEFNYNSSTALSQGVSFSGTGGTLSGSGTINQAVNVTTGNTLAIGNSVGTMNFGGNLTIAGTYLFELNNTNNTADLGDVAGTLTLGGILDLVQLGAYTAGDKFTLLAYDGTLTGLFKDSGGITSILDDTNFTDAGGSWTLNYNDTTAGLNGGVSASNTYVTITAIPEPGAALLGGLGMLMLLRRRR